MRFPNEQLLSGETKRIEFDLRGLCEQKATSVTSAVWDAPYHTISGQSVASNVVSTFVTNAISNDWCVSGYKHDLRVSVVLANGETIVCEKVLTD